MSYTIPTLTSSISSKPIGNVSGIILSLTQIICSIRFESIEFLNSDEYMPLEITPAPDTLIRILMQYKPLSRPINVTEQILTTPKREGFVVVEWGGTKI